jgi:hypothetical protein
MEISFCAKGRGVLSVAMFCAAALAVSDARSDCGVDLYNVTVPVGGDTGYPTIFTSAGADFVVSTRTALVSAIQNAQPGDIIYVSDSAQIDLIPAGLPPAQWTIPIDVPNLTIASGRGRNGSAGGKLYIDVADTATTDDPERSHWPPLFNVKKPGVRFTGLRLTGNDTAIGSTTYSPPVISGVFVDGSGALEVDNCQLWGWSHGAINAEGTTVNVHHNHIHHNRRTGLGYGVVLSDAASATIESNIFDHNRHDVAGTGYPFQSYAARYNLVVGEGTSHSFDMHGEGERAGTPSGFAGGQIIVEYNTFLDDGVNAATIRGAPYNFG